MAVAAAADNLVQIASTAFMPNYGARSIVMERGAGARCWDAEGNEYLDFLGGIAVNNVGHCHPKVVEAIKAQAEKLIHCSNFFMVESQIRLAERLTREAGMAKAFFSNSGTEATEAAMKLARKWAIAAKGSHRTTILCFEGSFHGRTWGAMSATWSKKVREGFGPLVSGYRFARFNDLPIIDQVWDDTVCAVLVETVQGEGGINVATPEFLQGLRRRCTERGALLICDEIQCGMGRTGKPFAFQHAGVEADVMPFAKAVGGGLPLGGILAAAPFADVLTQGSHGTTFGGNPVACAAGLAASEIVFDPATLGSVEEKGAKFRAGLAAMKKDFPDLVEGVRGLGLMVGCVLTAPCADLVAIGRKHGLLFNCTADRVIRFLPPLTIGDAEVDEALAKFGAAMKEFAGKRQ